MTSFNGLPREILFHIVEATADSSLYSLISLIRASKTCYQIYQTHVHDLTLRSTKAFTGPFLEHALVLAHVQKVWDMFKAYDRLADQEAEAKTGRDYYKIWLECSQEYEDMSIFEDVFARPITLELLRKAYRMHHQVKTVACEFTSRSSELAPLVADPKKLVHLMCGVYEMLLDRMFKYLDDRFHEQYGFDHGIRWKAEQCLGEKSAHIYATEGLGAVFHVTEYADLIPDKWVSGDDLAEGIPPYVFLEAAMERIIAKEITKINSGVSWHFIEISTRLMSGLALSDWYRYVMALDEPERATRVVETFLRNHKYEID